MMEYLSKLDMGAIFTGVGVIAALIALDTWKKQIRLSRQTSYLDDLVGELFICITEFQTSIDMFKHLRNAVWAESNREWGDMNLSVEDVKLFYAVSEKKRLELGHDGVRTFLQDSLEKPFRSRSKLYALRHKGIMHNLRDYEIMAAGITKIIEQIETLEKVSMAISMRHLNVEDPRLQGNLQFIASKTDEELRVQLNTCYKELMIQIKIHFDDIFGSRMFNLLKCKYLEFTEHAPDSQHGKIT